MLKVTDREIKSCNGVEIVKVNPKFIVKGKSGKSKVINRIILNILKFKNKFLKRKERIVPR